MINTHPGFGRRAGPDRWTRRRPDCCCCWRCSVWLDSEWLNSELARPTMSSRIRKWTEMVAETTNEKATEPQHSVVLASSVSSWILRRRQLCGGHVLARVLVLWASVHRRWPLICVRHGASSCTCRRNQSPSPCRDPRTSRCHAFAPRRRTIPWAAVRPDGCPDCPCQPPQWPWQRLP